MSRLKRQKRALPRVFSSRSKPPSTYTGPETAPASALSRAEQAMRALRPRTVGRQAIRLLRWADAQRWIHPEQPVIPFWDPAYQTVLKLLAGLRWCRDPESLGPTTDLRVLGRHLLCAFPVPDFLLSFLERANVWEERANTERFARLVACVGQGGNYQDARAIVPEFSRRSFGIFLQSPAEYSLWEALIRAQVRVLEGPDWLGAALAQVPAHLWNLSARLRQMEWLCQQQELTPADLGPFLAYLLQNPHLDLSGRTLGSVRRMMEARPQPAPVPADPRPFGSSGVKPFQTEDGWQIAELLSPEELVAEGRALRHCVAIYTSFVRCKTVSIWSLRKDDQRILTIELRSHNRSISQIRGFLNRAPTSFEMAVIRQWAQAAGLTVAV